MYLGFNSKICLILIFEAKTDDGGYSAGCKEMKESVSIGQFAVEELRDLRDTHGVPDAVLAAVQAELAKIFAPVAQQLIQHMQPVAAGGAGGGGPGAGGLLAAGLPALFTPGTAGGGPAGVAPGSGGGSGGAPPPMSMMPPFMPGGGAFGARAGAAAGAQ